MGKVSDLTGNRYGKLTVIRRAPDRYGKNRKYIRWECACDCGNILNVDATNLINGNTKSCGCISNIVDVTGKRFGKLTVLRQAGKTTSGSVIWECLCDCGNKTNVVGTSLRRGTTHSCGCGIVDGLKCGWEQKTHGGAGTRLYGIWSGIKNRTSPNADKRHIQRYYLRGIRICKEWEKSFEAFRDWALANGYDETAPYGECTIDRIDNNGNYCPDNCRWISNKEQASNKESNRNFTYNGETKNMSAWAKEYGLSPKLLRQRLILLGWDIEKALTTPSQRKR